VLLAVPHRQLTNISDYLLCLRDALPQGFALYSESKPNLDVVVSLVEFVLGDVGESELFCVDAEEDGEEDYYEFSHEIIAIILENVDIII
jgi:hypothetical protein